MRSLVVAMSESSVVMLERRTREQFWGDLMIVACQADTEYEFRLSSPQHEAVSKDRLLIRSWRTALSTNHLLLCLTEP